MSKIPLGIIISHMSVDEGNYPKSSLYAFRDVVHQLDMETSGKIRLAFDYEGYEDLRKNNSSQESILRTIDELKSQYEHLIFFRLIDPEYGSGMRLEFDCVREKNKGVKDNKQIAIRTLFKKYDITDSNYKEAESTWREITDKRDQKSDVSWRYVNDDDLRAKAREMITRFYFSKNGQNIWKWLLLALFIGVVLYLFSGPIHNILFSNQQQESEDVITPPGVEENAGPVQSNPAKEEKSPGVRAEKDGQGNIERDPIVYLNNGYVLTGISGAFENYVLAQIESTSDLRRAPGKQVQWSISFTETKYERGVDDGDYFVDLSVSVSIVNNNTGLALPKLPLYKNECIGSPISYEDAFINAASEEFAKRIANGIVNTIQNEK